MLQQGDAGASAATRAAATGITLVLRLAGGHQGVTRHRAQAPRTLHQRGLLLL